MACAIAVKTTMRLHGRFLRQKFSFLREFFILARIPNFWYLLTSQVFNSILLGLLVWYK